MKPILSVKNLKIGLAHKKHLYFPSQETSFEVKRNTFLGIVGESGSGKSLTLNALTGIREISPGILEGEITYRFSDKEVKILDELPRYMFGRNGSTQKNFQLWRKHVLSKMKPLWGNYIGLVFQDSVRSLNPYLTVGQHMYDALSFTNLSLSEKKEKALQMLREVQLRNPEKVFYSFPHELSGGMAQRVMLAISLVGDPEFLILDEPTVGLDVTLQTAITDLLHNIQKKHEISGLVVSHDLKFISRITQTVVVMLAGEIWEIGAAQDITHEEFPWKHPYTEYLLRKAELGIERDNMDTNLHLPEKGSTGCRYRSRCAHYQQCSDAAFKSRCDNERPPLINVYEEHFIRCWKFTRKENG